MSSIGPLSTNAFWLTAATKPSAKQAVSTDSNPAPAASNNDIATNVSTRQKLPSPFSDATNTALLSLQEVGAASSSAAAEPKEIKFIFQGKEVTAKRLDATLNATHVSELPEELYQGFLAGLEHALQTASMGEANAKPADSAYLANHPAMKPYATVEVGGKVVATVDNQGVMSTSNEIDTLLGDRIPNDINGTNGPNLAQARAEKIAELLGGKVVKSSTAITQSQFDANPIDPERLRAQFNAEAMKNDPLYAQIQTITARRAAFLAQQAV